MNALPIGYRRTRSLCADPRRFLCGSGDRNDQNSRSLSETSESGSVVATSGGMSTSGAPRAIHFSRISVSAGSIGLMLTSISRVMGGISPARIFLITRLSSGLPRTIAGPAFAAAYDRVLGPQVETRLLPPRSVTNRAAPEQNGDDFMLRDGIGRLVFGRGNRSRFDPTANRFQLGFGQPIFLGWGISPDATFSKSRLCSGSLAVMAGPDSPPLSKPASDRRSSSALRSVSPWHLRHFALKIGATSVSKSGPSAATAGRLAKKTQVDECQSRRGGAANERG